MWTVEFECKKCGDDFEENWTFGDEVKCPQCGTWWETDFETNYDDDIFGPWLDREITDPEEIKLLETSTMGSPARESGGKREMEWQPIKTSPREDGYYLVYATAQPHEHCWLAGYFFEDESGGWWEFSDPKGHPASLGAYIPTHWMPLPPPPED